MNKINLSLELSHYNRILKYYRKEKNAIRKLKLKFELNSSRDNIFTFLDDENLSFEELFSVLKKYEITAKGEIFFNCYRLFYQNKHSDDKYFMDCIKVFFRTEKGVKSKTLVVFDNFNYEENHDKFVGAKIIKVTEVINGDVKETLKKLYKCMDHYDKINQCIIMHLIENNVV